MSLLCGYQPLSVVSADDGPVDAWMGRLIEMRAKEGMREGCLLLLLSVGRWGSVLL